MKKPIYLGGLVSSDSELGGIIIEMNRSSVDVVEQLRLDPEGGDGLDNLYPQVSYRAIEAILGRPEYAGFEFFHTGDVALNATYNLVFIEDELPLLTGLSVLLIALSLAIVFRRPLGVIGPFMVIAFAMAFSLAVIGALGWQIDFMFGLMPILLITVGVANAVHILSEFDIYYRKLRDSREAIRRTLYLVGAPCLLASLTTAVGFLSLSLSPVKTVAHLAIYSSAGVIAAFLASVTILVAFLTFSREPKTERAQKRLAARAKRAEQFGAALRAVASFVIRFRNSILVVFALIFIVSAWGVTKLTVDSNFLLEFSEDIPVRRTTQFVDDNMSGNYSIVYVFDSGEPDGIKNPAVLREIERVQKEAEKHPLVNKTYSVVDMMKDINQSFHNGDPAYYRIPESRDLIAQQNEGNEPSQGDRRGHRRPPERAAARSLDDECHRHRCALAEVRRIHHGEPDSGQPDSAHGGQLDDDFRLPFSEDWPHLDAPQHFTRGARDRFHGMGGCLPRLLPSTHRASGDRHRSRRHHPLDDPLPPRVQEIS
jgi:predicted RND superfamily exporter protein